MIIEVCSSCHGSGGAGKCRACAGSGYPPGYVPPTKEQVQAWLDSQSRELDARDRA